jgi:hypothetical protein
MLKNCQLSYIFRNTLKPLIKLRYAAFVLFLCCIQSVATAADNTPLSNAMAMSERQLSTHLLNNYRAHFISREKGEGRIKLTQQELDLMHSVWGQLLDIRGLEADRYVLNLLNYETDETSDSSVITSLQCRRSRILADLRRIKKRGPVCEPAYQQLCADKEVWEIRVEEINKIIANKNEVHQKYCTTELYSPAVLAKPKKRK